MKIKRYQIPLILLSITILNACTSVKGDDSKIINSEEENIKAVQIELINKSDIKEELNLTGTISGKGQTMLSTKIPGRIDHIYYDIGDHVNKGDLLVKLNSDETEAQLKSARTNYQNTLINLQKTKKLMNTQINNAENTINTLKLRLKALENTKQSVNQITKKQVDLVKKQVDLVKTRLNNVNRKLDKNQSDIDEQKIHLIDQSLILSKSILEQLYGILNINEGNLDYDTEIDKRFGQADHKIRTSIIQSLRKFRNSIDTVEKKCKIPETSNLNDCFKLAKDNINNTKKSLDLIQKLLLNTVSHKNLSQFELSNIRAQVADMKQKSEAILLSISDGQVIGLDGLSQSESGINLERKNQEDELNEQLKINENQLNLSQLKREQELESMRDKILILESQINESKNAKLTAIANKEAQSQILKIQIDQIKGQIKILEINHKNSLLKAPQDGVIISKMAEEKMIIAAGTPLIEFANPQNIQIKSEIAEENIPYIKNGMNAEFTIDSLKNKIFHAKITKIGASSNIITRKIPIEFKILENIKDLKIGSYARIKIQLKSKRKGFLITDQALKREEYNNFVFIIQNERAYKIPVKIGKRYKDKIEILSGIYPKNKIIVNGYEGLKNGEKVKILNP